MRTAFINQLVLEAETNDNIFLLVADLGYSVVEEFQNKFPNRFLNVGIAEQNMAGIAAGLAHQGFSVFIYSIGNFPTLRCIEQIRYDIAYHQLNVTIVAVGAGYAYASLGPSHHATEDIGMLRVIPNMVVCSPSDPLEAKLLTTFCSKHNGPSYLRLGKAGEKVIHTSTNYNSLNIGEILPVIRTEEKNKVSKCIFATGSIVIDAKAHIEKNENLQSHDLYSFPFIKPIDKSFLFDLFSEYDEIITIEEHQLDCGFGSAILEYLNEYQNTVNESIAPKVRRIAIKNQFISIAGNQSYLRSVAELNL
jgi:transketolase